jgi:starch synthase
MRILFVSSEIYPLAKTGGLADVSAALPAALAARGVDVRLVMPGYPRALMAAVDKRLVLQLPARDGRVATRLFAARLPESDLPVYLVDAPDLFNRDGGLYQDAHGHDWADNAARFAHFSRIAAELACGRLLRGWRADVVHANDWHTGLLPLFLGEGPLRPPVLFTIHNLAFQGLFPAETLAALRLAPELLTPDGIEFFGQMSFLKAGIRFSERLNTVSPTYAREILTQPHGCGLDGLLQHRADDLSGILNGVDYAVWDPAADPHLPARFDPHDLTGKHSCKLALQREFGLEPVADTPLLVWASRITHQKMADVALEVLPGLLQQHPIQFALVGEGEAAFEQRFAELARAFPGRVAAHLGYAEPVAHRVFAAGDLLLHPARFEPCGLTPLYAMRYGTVPIASRVGGLADTIVDADESAIRNGGATGFACAEPGTDALRACIERALAAYAQPVLWRRIQQRAMAQDFGWDRSARRYLSLYRALAPQAAVSSEATAERSAAEAAAAPDAAAA